MEKKEPEEARSRISLASRFARVIISRDKRVFTEFVIKQLSLAETALSIFHGATLCLAFKFLYS